MIGPQVRLHRGQLDHRTHLFSVQRIGRLELFLGFQEPVVVIGGNGRGRLLLVLPDLHADVDVVAVPDDYQGHDRRHCQHLSHGGPDRPGRFLYQRGGPYRPGIPGPTVFTGEIGYLLAQGLQQLTGMRVGRLDLQGPGQLGHGLLFLAALQENLSQGAMGHGGVGRMLEDLA